MEKARRLGELQSAKYAGRDRGNHMEWRGVPLVAGRLTLANDTKGLISPFRFG